MATSIHARLRGSAPAKKVTGVTSPKYEYKRHALSAVFGDMPKDMHAELVDDIKQNGLRNPIYKKGSEIVDGWNRYTAAVKAGVKLSEDDFYEYDEKQDGPLVELVMSLNAHRRHLTPASRVEIAKKLMGEGYTQKSAAEAAGMHPKSLTRALGKEKPEKKVTGVTLEGLKKRKKMLEGQLKNVNAQIAELEGGENLKSISKTRRVRGGLV